VPPQRNTSATYSFSSDINVSNDRSREIMNKSGRFKRSIVTEIVPASKFYTAKEDGP
jgi:peptide methionine sulfoxide reductase MsrA